MKRNYYKPNDGDLICLDFPEYLWTTFKSRNRTTTFLYEIINNDIFQLLTFPTKKLRKFYEKKLL